MKCNERDQEGRMKWRKEVGACPLNGSSDHRCRPRRDVFESYPSLTQEIWVVMKKMDKTICWCYLCHTSVGYSWKWTLTNITDATLLKAITQKIVKSWKRISMRSYGKTFPRTSSSSKWENNPNHKREGCRPRWRDIKLKKHSRRRKEVSTLSTNASPQEEKLIAQGRTTPYRSQVFELWGSVLGSKTMLSSTSLRHAWNTSLVLMMNPSDYNQSRWIQHENDYDRLWQLKWHSLSWRPNNL